ncbi:MAG: molecular chaperone TorD family protein [Burkholderiales bacterium]|nr:molecular chaperone TorD family protein [Burkholderiales bacterium]
MPAPPTPDAIDLAPPQDTEETARAELYGLLARLWLAPPDDALLAQFRVAVTEAPEPGGHLERPWHDLVAAMRGSTAAAARDEFGALFEGVGKPEVFVYGSYYLSGALNDRPLAQLRSDLAALGLGRDEARMETEDHVAYVFEVMRYLIAGEDAGTCNLEQQRRFFRAHLQPWVERLCDAVQAHPGARLWGAVAGFTRAFVEVETQGFDLLEA